MSAAVEKLSNAEAVEGTGNLVQAIQTHSDDARRRAGWQSRSWQGSAHAIFRCPDGTRSSTPIIPAPLTAAVQLAAPPTASQHLTAHCLRAQRKLAAAVPGVVRTSSSCACTQYGYHVIAPCNYSAVITTPVFQIPGIAKLRPL